MKANPAKSGSAKKPMSSTRRDVLAYQAGARQSKNDPYGSIGSKRANWTKSQRQAYLADPKRGTDYPNPAFGKGLTAGSASRKQVASGTRKSVVAKAKRATKGR